MNRFKTLYVIGEGSFGIVYLAQENSSSNLVAIKKMKRKYNSWEECMNLREVRSLRKIRHENIIKLREVFREENQLHLVFDYLETNLFKYYSSHFKEKGRSIPEIFIKKTILQTLKGLAHLHEKGFFHRDMKPENLLINSDGSVKLADFGLAREIRSMPPYTDYISTRWYRAPEMLLKMTNYSHPVDIFAVGCIMAELILQKPLFDGKSELDQLHKIFSVLGEPGVNWKEGLSLTRKLGIQTTGKKGRDLSVVIKGASPQALDLLKKMFQLDPLKRGSANSLIEHAFFDEVRISEKPIETDEFSEIFGKKLKQENIYKKKKGLHFKDIVKLDFEDIEKNLNSNYNDKKTTFKNKLKYENKNMNFNMNKIPDLMIEDVSPSMKDFYSSQDDGSLMDNKSMTDEIEQIINQHNNKFQKTSKLDLLKKTELNPSFSTLSKFSMKKKNKSNFKEKNNLAQIRTPKSFIPYMSDKFNLKSNSKKSLLNSETQLKKTQNKENVKSFKPDAEDILPSYMRFMGNVNSQSDFKFHF